MSQFEESLHPYWVTFTDGSAGTVDGYNPMDAIDKAMKHVGKAAVTAEILPYPATPVLWMGLHEPHGPCPAFCYTPRECKGKTSCPKRRACSE